MEGGCGGGEAVITAIRVAQGGACLETITPTAVHLLHRSNYARLMNRVGWPAGMDCLAGKRAEGEGGQGGQGGQGGEREQNRTGLSAGSVHPSCSLAQPGLSDSDAAPPGTAGHSQAQPERGRVRER